MGPIIKKYTGRSAWDYNGYGCYCGYRGSGTPVDSTDRCCMEHDQCYTRTSCGQSHIQAPSVDCSGADCVCTSPRGKCRYESCACDVALGQCLGRATYNSANKNRC
ncbi:unnamed protein product [Lymnaea stagnalis]|uniref:Phospholipase A2 n=1 Tax=Lymnaea stagnalis TaxID=6523 RepID=A0AAV2H6R5_LYMST